MDNLEQRIKALEDAQNKDNFSGVKIFRNKVQVLSHFKVPHYASVPTGGGFSIGELIESGGKLYICTVATSSACTFTVVGSQS